MRRISSQQPAQDVGVEHIQALDEAPQACLGALDLVAAKGKDGNRRCLSRVSGLRVVARLRSERVLDRPAEPISGKRGRPPTDGERFGCKDEQMKFRHFKTKHYGKVRLKRCNGLRDKRTPKLTCDILGAETHLDKDKPPAAV